MRKKLTPLREVEAVAKILKRRAFSDEAIHEIVQTYMIEQLFRGGEFNPTAEGADFVSVRMCTDFMPELL